MADSTTRGGDRRARNARGSGARLREEIVAAGVRLVDEAGDPAALTLRGVARTAGIAAPSVYQHFPDLTAVTDAVLAASFAELHEVVAAAIASTASEPEALLAGCSAYVHFAWAHRARYQLMFAAEGYASNAVATYRAIEEALRRCVAAGRSSSADPHGDTFLLWAAMHGIATLNRPARDDYLRLGPLDRPAIVLELVRRLARLM
ncbi:MAG: TetR/AcrR family transcriptional regulator [Minicystis sp.]